MATNVPSRAVDLSNFRFLHPTQPLRYMGLEATRKISAHTDSRPFCMGACDWSHDTQKPLHCVRRKLMQCGRAHADRQTWTGNSRASFRRRSSCVHWAWYKGRWQQIIQFCYRVPGVSTIQYSYRNRLVAFSSKF